MGRPIVDLIGNKYGYLTVNSLDEERSNNKVKYWTCICECGNIISVRGGSLKCGGTTSCGCHSCDSLIINNHNRAVVIERGTVFGQWTVTSKDIKSSYIHKTSYYFCECSCGTVRSVKADSLLSGRSTSCGCIKSKGEKRISQILRNLGVDFEQQKVFSDCLDKAPLRFDFYIPLINMCVEYNGSQHYSTGFGWNNSEKLLKTSYHDNIKKEYCMNNNIPMLTIPYTLYPYLDNNTLFLLIFVRLVLHYKTKISLISRLVRIIKVD